MERYPRFLALVLVFSLASCARGNPVPATATKTETMPLTIAPTDTVSSEIQPITPTAAASPTSTATTTITANPTGYELKDWREPMEVITPDNINQVERIGELVFGSDVATLAWSPEGSKLAVVSGFELFVMDSSSFAKIFQFNSVIASALAFSPDLKILQIGLPYLDMATGKMINQDRMDVPYPGTDIEFSLDGNYRVNMGTDYAIISYYTNKGLPDIAFGRQYFSGMHVSISRDSKLFAVNYGLLNYTELWDPYTVRPIRKLELQGITAQGKPRFSANGTSIFFTGKGTWENQDASFIQEWDYATGKPLDVQLLPENVVVTGNSMDLSPSADMVIFGGISGGVYIEKTHDCHASKIGQSFYSTIVVQASFRPDGKMFATIEDNNQGTIDLWGIPGTGGTNNISTPTVTGPETPCPKISMIPESLTPEAGWQSGGVNH